MVLGGICGSGNLAIACKPGSLDRPFADSDRRFDHWSGSSFNDLFLSIQSEHLDSRSELLPE